MEFHPGTQRRSDATPAKLESHIVLCGLGSLGHHILGLLARLGERVAVITMDPPCDWPPPKCEGFPLFTGDARDEKLLRQASIATAKAVIITTSDDLTNVSIALDARRLNPTIPVVVRLFDQQLGEHLEKGAGIHRALSTSALAAPAFVGAALGNTTRGSFETGDGSCMISEWTVMESSPEIGKRPREWGASSGWWVIGLCRGSSWMLEELDSMVLQAGDVLTLLRMAPCVGAGVIPPAESPRGTAGRTPTASSRVSNWRTLWLGLREWWRDVPSALHAALGVLFLVVLASVILFRWKMNMPFVDAIYFVVTIVTTVGFGDYNFQNAPPYLKLYGALLMLCGAAMLATLFSIITDLVLSTRFRDLLARGCSRFHGHIIVVGLGNLGFRVLRELARNGEKLVAVECDAGGKFVETARSLAPVVLGNARTEETLQKAGLAGAKAVLALTDNDITNLCISLAAKRARPGVWSVLRVFDASLANKVRASVGVNVVLSVSAEATATFAGAALGPDVLHGFLMGDFLIVIFKRSGVTGTTQTPAAKNEVVIPAGGFGARWYRLRKED